MKERQGPREYRTLLHVSPNWWGYVPKSKEKGEYTQLPTTHRVFSRVDGTNNVSAELEGERGLG